MRGRALHFAEHRHFLHLARHEQPVAALHDDVVVRTRRRRDDPVEVDHEATDRLELAEVVEQRLADDQRLRGRLLRLIRA